MDDFERNVKALLEAGDASAIVGLAPVSKAQRKAVKRALYLLKERGVAIPETGSGPAPGRALGGAGLPVLMAAPQPEDGRKFTLAIPSGSGLEIVEARFEMPQGLKVLQSNPSSRAQFGPWATKMCARPGSGLPERVKMPSGMLARKLFELRLAREGERVGPDVDRRLLERLTKSAPAVPHPLDAGGAGKHLSMAELAREPWRLALFNHEEPLDQIARQTHGSGGRSLALRADEGSIRRAAAEWAQEWGDDGIKESLRDAAAWCLGFGDADGAATLSAAAAGDTTDFLADYAVLRLS